MLVKSSIHSVVSNAPIFKSFVKLFSNSRMENATGFRHEDPVNAYILALVGMAIAVIILFGIVGNTFTIASYTCDKQLRSVYNTYLFILAVTDLLLSVAIMPIYAVYTLRSYEWPFGNYFCKVYNFIDYALCLESVLIVMIISLDRLLLIRLGSHYSIKVTMRLAYVQISASWIIAFALYGPFIIGWEKWTGENILEKRECQVQFSRNSTFTTITALIEFGIPLIFVGIVNCIVYNNIKKRKYTKLYRDYRASGVSAGKRSRSRLNRRDFKAAKFLTALVLALFITWAPFTIATIINAFCEECLNKYLYEFLKWLLWSKAAINPFLYAYHSARFKRNFEKLVKTFVLRENAQSKEQLQAELIGIEELKAVQLKNI